MENEKKKPELDLSCTSTENLYKVTCGNQHWYILGRSVANVAGAFELIYRDGDIDSVELMGPCMMVRNDK